MKGFISKDDRNLNQWPTWLCVLLLFVCMTFSGYVPASMSAYMLGTAYFRAYGIEYSLWMVILTNGIVSIALFELFSRILFQLGVMFSRRTILMYPPARCPSSTSPCWPTPWSRWPFSASF